MGLNWLVLRWGSLATHRNNPLGLGRKAEARIEEWASIDPRQDRKANN
jgi:hypothetical protein